MTTVVALLSPVIGLAVVMALQVVEQWVMTERGGARQPAGERAARRRASRRRARLRSWAAIHHDLEKNFVVR
ncbi:MAG TPA: hypothetical protein VGK60_08865 [Pedococcus sp.]